MAISISLSDLAGVDRCLLTPSAGPEEYLRPLGQWPSYPGVLHQVWCACSLSFYSLTYRYPDIPKQRIAYPLPDTSGGPHTVHCFRANELRFNAALPLIKASLQSGNRKSMWVVILGTKPHPGPRQHMKRDQIGRVLPLLWISRACRVAGMGYGKGGGASYTM